MTLFRVTAGAAAFSLAMILSPAWLRVLLFFPFGLFCGRALAEWNRR